MKFRKRISIFTFRYLIYTKLNKWKIMENQPLNCTEHLLLEMSEPSE